MGFKGQKSKKKLFAKKMIRNHSFGTFAKFSEKLSLLTSWYAHVNVTFSEKSACVLNGGSLFVKNVIG